MQSELTAQKPTYVLTKVILEEQRKGRHHCEDVSLSLGCGCGRCEKRVKEVLLIIKNSISEGGYFNYLQLEMRQQGHSPSGL